LYVLNQTVIRVRQNKPIFRRRLAFDQTTRPFSANPVVHSLKYDWARLFFKCTNSQISELYSIKTVGCGSRSLCQRRQDYRAVQKRPIKANVKYGMTNTENVRLYNVCRLWSNKKHFGHASKKNGFSNNLKLRWKPKIAETSQKVDLCHLLVLVAAIFDFRLNHPVYGNDPNLAQNRWCDPIRLKKSGCGRFWLSVMGLKCVSIYNRIWKTVWLTMVKNHKKNTFL